MGLSDYRLWCRFKVCSMAPVLTQVRVRRARSVESGPALAMRALGARRRFYIPMMRDQAELTLTGVSYLKFSSWESSRTIVKQACPHSMGPDLDAHLASANLTMDIEPGIRILDKTRGF